MKFRYNGWRAGLLVAALALVLGAGRPLPAAGEAPPAAQASPTPICPDAGPSPSVACDKQILLSIRDTLADDHPEKLSSWHPNVPLVDFEGITVGGSRPGSWP